MTQRSIVSQPDYLLYAMVDDASHIASTLRTICFVEEATVIITDKGLKVSVEQTKTIQARVFLQKQLFQEYYFIPDDDSEQHEFKISLKLWLDCLTIFGEHRSSALKLQLGAAGEPLQLTLEDCGIVTDCQIRTLEPGRSPDFNIKSADVPSNIIMKSQWLAEVFSELDVTAAEVEVHISPDRPYFRLSTSGDTGITQVECPKDSDVVDSFTCQQTLINSFHLKGLKNSEKALSLSQKISIRINVTGMMSIQYLIQTEEDPIFIEFLFLPTESPDEYEYQEGY